MPTQNLYKSFCIIFKSRRDRNYTKSFCIVQDWNYITQIRTGNIIGLQIIPSIYRNRVSIDIRIVYQSLTIKDSLWFQVFSIGGDTREAVPWERSIPRQCTSCVLASFPLPIQNMIGTPYCDIFQTLEIIYITSSKSIALLTFTLIPHEYIFFQIVAIVCLLKQKTYRLKKRDLLTQRHKKRQIKLLNLGSMHFYKCQSHIL